MSGLDRAGARLVHKLPCTSDVAEAPSRDAEIRDRREFRVRTEAELGFAVSLGVVDSQRMFEARAPPFEIALVEDSHSQYAMRGGRLRRPHRVFRCAQEALG